jgi:hypothetical protein
MRRQVAQLAGFVDQARLFRTLLAITNKLHSRFSLEWTDRLNSFMEQGGGKFNRSKRSALQARNSDGASGHGGHPSASNLNASPSRLMYPAE